MLWRSAATQSMQALTSQAHLLAIPGCGAAGGLVLRFKLCRLRLRRHVLRHRRGWPGAGALPHITQVRVDNGADKFHLTYHTDMRNLSRL